MRLLAPIALAASLCGLAGSPQAQGVAHASPETAAPKAVVELFTSQGCSSCPAADALLGRLARRDDVIAISLSVDYWDYLGWKDTLAQGKFAERQKAYAKVLGDGMVYTPQAVVNGAVHVNGSDEDKITRAIDKTLAAVAVAPVRLSAVGGRLVVDIGAAAPGVTAKEATVWLAVMSQSVNVPITRGENKGKTVTYSNVARELIPIGMWSGKPVTVQLERHSIGQKGVERCAVFVQQGRGGPIAGAALLHDC